MTIRDKIMQKLDEEVKHHHYAIVYRVKNGDGTIHQENLSVHGKHSKAEADKMLHDHLKKNNVELHPGYRVGYSTHYRNDQGLGSLATHKVQVSHTRQGETHRRDATVRIRDAKSPKDAVEKAKKYITDKYKGSTIHHEHTGYAGTGK